MAHLSPLDATMVMGGATFQPSASPINPPGRHSPFNRPTSAPHGTRRLRSKRSLRIASSHVGANASATSPPRGPANSPPHDGVAAERSRASPTQLLSVVGLDDADDTAVRNTIFWRGAARHGVDPRLIHPMGPGPQKSPSVDLIKPRVTGGGWGASTASRGLEGYPKPEPRRRKRVKKKGKKKGKKKVTPTDHTPPTGSPDTQPALKRGKSGRSARQLKLSLSSSHLHSLSKKGSASGARPVMISTGLRSPPAAWTGSWYSSGRNDTPPPGSYDPPTFLEEAQHRRQKPTSGTFGSNTRSNPRDPACFLPFNDWSPPPNSYTPDDTITRWDHGTASLHPKLEHGSLQQASNTADSPGPKYFPNPNSPVTTFAAAPKFSFGGGASRTPRDGPQLVKKSSRGTISVGLLSARTASSRAMSRGSPSPQPSPQTLQRLRGRGSTPSVGTIPRVISTSELRRRAASKLMSLDSARSAGPSVFTFEDLDDE